MTLPEEMQRSVRGMRQMIHFGRPLKLTLECLQSGATPAVAEEGAGATPAVGEEKNGRDDSVKEETAENPATAVTEGEGENN